LYLAGWGTFNGCETGGGTPMRGDGRRGWTGGGCCLPEGDHQPICSRDGGVVSTEPTRTWASNDPLGVDIRRAGGYWRQRAASRLEAVTACCRERAHR